MKGPQAKGGAFRVSELVREPSGERKLYFETFTTGASPSVEYLATQGDVIQPAEIEKWFAPLKLAPTDWELSELTRLLTQASTSAAFILGRRRMMSDEVEFHLGEKFHQSCSSCAKFSLHMVSDTLYDERSETIAKNLPVPQVPLTAIPSVLKSRYGKSVSYQKVWQAAVDARLPAEQLTNGRWIADPDDAAELFEIGEAAAA